MATEHEYSEEKPTCHLRWFPFYQAAHQGGGVSHGIAEVVFHLQQAWEVKKFSDGKCIALDTEWRDVPTEGMTAPQSVRSGGPS